MGAWRKRAIRKALSGAATGIEAQSRQSLFTFREKRIFDEVSTSQRIVSVSATGTSALRNKLNLNSLKVCSGPKFKFILKLRFRSIDCS